MSKPPVSTAKSRQPLKRALRVVSRLLRGESIDVEEARAVMDVGYAAATETLKTIREVLGANVVRKYTAGRRVHYELSGVRFGEPSNEVAIAACYGAALSPLFKGTSLEKEIARALSYVVEASPKPDNFRDFDRKFFFVRRGGEIALPANSRYLEQLTTAVIHQYWVDLQYTRFNGECEKVKVRPLAIAVYDHQLYVIADNDGRVTPLRFSRIEMVRKTNKRFDYPEDFSPEELFHDVFGIFVKGEGAPEPVRVRLDKSWRAYARSHAWHPSQTITENPDGSVDVVLTVRVCSELKRWILSFGDEAKVMDPLALRDEIAETFQRASRGYESRTARKSAPRSPRRSPRSKA